MTGAGIFARNSHAGNNTILSITTAVGTTTSGLDGIDATHDGTGATTIIANGDVTGGAGAGIDAFNSLATSSAALSITTGAGTTVQGGTAGIQAQHAGTGTVAITNNGTVQNLSGLVGGLAINVVDGASVIENNALVLGRITTGGDADTFTNDGFWAFTGTSDFGGGVNAVINNGLVFAAVDDFASEAAVISNATFTNNAGVSLGGLLADDSEGNGSILHDTLIINGNFVANAGSGLVMNAFLDPVGSADLLTINGNVTGVSEVFIVNTNPLIGGAPPAAGIDLVVVNGTTAQGDFVLANGPIQAGLFSYDIVLNVNTHELVGGVGVVGAELPTFASAAQSIWHGSAGVVSERFEMLREDETQAAMVIDNNTTVKPVGDVAMANGNDGGVWGKVLGRASDRDANSDVLIMGVPVDIGYDLDMYGFLMGADAFVSDGLALGVTGGYLNASQDFNSGTQVDYEGVTAGVYATWAAGGFHLDAQFKADVLELDAELSGGAGSAEADVVNLGGLVAMGYRLGGPGFYAEPVAQLAYVDTDISNGDVLGVGFEIGGDSLQGAVGVNVGGAINASGETMIKPVLGVKLVNEFEGDNTATFAGFSTFDNTPEMFGEASFAIEAISMAGWTGILQADAQFAEEFLSYGGSAALRWSF